MDILNSRKNLKLKPQRRGFFVALTIVLAFSLPAWPAESEGSFGALNGQIYDQQGTPVPYVSIDLADQHFLSDQRGSFALTVHSLDSDSVRFYRIGFSPQTVAVTDLLMQSKVVLSPSLIKTGAVQITGEKVDQRTALALSQYTKLASQGLMDHQHLLRKVPGLSVRSYGGPAGVSSMSVDGGPASHTKVMVDDIDLTSSQNGEADLSQLPLPYIESMAYTPYDITSNSVGSVDGSIELSPPAGMSHLRFSTGSYGHRAYDMALTKQVGAFITYIQSGQRHETADYPFEWGTMKGTRLNNDLDQQFISLRLMRMLGSRAGIKLTGLVSKQSRGVAGLVWSQDLESHRNDLLQLWGFTGWIRHSRGLTRVGINARNSQEAYFNPALGLDTQHDLEGYHLVLKDRSRITPALNLHLQLKLHHDYIRSRDTRSHSRESLDFALTPELTLWRFKIAPSFKLLHSNGLYEKAFTDIQIRFEPSPGLLPDISASKAHLYNYPTFNDLYWTPGGNPDLEPEQNVVETLQLKYSLRGLGNVMLQYQHKESSDLIQWLPLHSYWQPSNVHSALRESMKLMWQSTLPWYEISLSTHYSRIHTLDRVRNKRLRYAPHTTANVDLSGSLLGARLTLNYTHLSDRISMYDYPQDIVLPAVDLWQLQVGKTFNIPQGALTLSSSFDNLTNQHYETIRGYPEPGFAYRISTQYAF